ncbi:rickettsial conserved hypothetical protein [Rickettsia typhi str. Wilmington]|uniref:Uncharacterized protein n=1 Tax=Rickettsia typhi (strain ATCC VR-144 / Wilmington) TaxID=257363 RepID=Q68W62_RICTY|nr:rickettsial conserved hypothetical protein [Rickettsia typhi str. Wilmington]
MQYKLLLITKNFHVLNIDINEHEQQATLICGKRKTLINAWYVNQHYQYFTSLKRVHITVSDMDIELMNAIAKIGINIEYNQNNWYQCKLDTQRYNADTIARDIYTTDSSNYAYF